jgi:hypothetical protein
MSARAARADIRWALCRYLALNDSERAAERADALLDKWAHELAVQQRQEMQAPGRSYDAARWNRCVDMVANVIDPQTEAPVPPAPRHVSSAPCTMHASDDHPAAVAWWICNPSRKRVHLCQRCLDIWFDNADDGNNEPAAWGWLPGCRPPATGGTVKPGWWVVGEDGGCILPALPLGHRRGLAILGRR